MLESSSAVGDVIKNGAGDYQREEGAPCHYPQTLCRQVHQNSLAQPSSSSTQAISRGRDRNPFHLTRKSHFGWESGWANERARGEVISLLGMQSD